MKDKRAREEIVELTKGIDDILRKIVSLHDRLDKLFEVKEEWILGECSTCGNSQLQLKHTKYEQVTQILEPECTQNHN